MFGKNRGYKQSETLKQFQLFRKRRNEKTSILHSENESVNVKVKCFQELIKLNRKGKGSNLPSNSIEDIQKCKSSKNIIQVTELHAETEQDNTDFAFGNLNRMAAELKSWEATKETSKHTASTKQFLKSSKLSRQQLVKNKADQKSTKLHSNSTNNSRVKLELTNDAGKCNWMGENEVKLDHFSVKRKHKQYLSRHLTSKRYHNYQNSTPNLKINIERQEFKGLKKQINELESKAKENYGICLETPQDEEIEPFLQSIEPEEKQVSRVFLRTDAKRNQENNYLRLMNEHLRQDSSIPTKFLGMIRCEAKARPITHDSWRRYLRI